jgi:hypothetical protein
VTFSGTTDGHDFRKAFMFVFRRRDAEGQGNQHRGEGDQQAMEDGIPEICA